jgi:hypothetical protein
MWSPRIPVCAAQAGPGLASAAHFFIRRIARVSSSRLLLLEMIAKNKNNFVPLCYVPTGAKMARRSNHLGFTSDLPSEQLRFRLCKPATSIEFSHCTLLGQQHYGTVVRIRRSQHGNECSTPHYPSSLNCYAKYRYFTYIYSICTMIHPSILYHCRRMGEMIMM